MRQIYNMSDSPPDEYFVFSSPDSPDTVIPNNGSFSSASDDSCGTPVTSLAAAITATSDFTLSIIGAPSCGGEGEITSPPQVSQCFPKALSMSQANELLKCFQTSCSTAGKGGGGTRLSLVNLLPSRSAFY